MSREPGVWQQCRSRLAALITSRAPTLIYYLSDSTKRRGLHIRSDAQRITIERSVEGKMIVIARHHAIYVRDVIECFDYYFSAVEPRTEGGLQVVDFSQPAMHDVVGFHDFPVEFPSMAEPIVTAHQYADFAQLGQGAVAIDLGSYAALTSIVFSKLVGQEGQVIAVEADPINQHVSLANIERHRDVNGLENIQLLKAAVASEDGFIEMRSEGAMGSAVSSVLGHARGESHRVRSYTLEGIAEHFGLERVDFVKMDIEGSEEPVLQTSRSFLTRFRPRLVIEPHVVNGVNSMNAVMSLLESYGYRCWQEPQTGVHSLPLVFAHFEVN